MRARLIVQVLSFAVIVAVATIWAKSRATAVGLQARLGALTTGRRNKALSMEQERDRLVAELAEAKRGRQAYATGTSSTRAQSVPSQGIIPSLALGEWRSSKQWRNEGQATARGTVATLLWAAAGGDLAAMIPLIAYDEASRTQAQALFESLPPSARQAFPTPEALVAGLTIQAVPNNEVQLSWFHQRDADHATVGLLLGLPDQTAPTEASTASAPTTRLPKILDPYSNQFAVLSLQRSSVGWRIVIPAAAVERLARRAKIPAG